MNREKRDKIPSMQVSFIDAICIQLYEASQSTENDCFLMTVIATYYYIIYKSYINSYLLCQIQKKLFLNLFYLVRFMYFIR